LPVAEEEHAFVFPLSIGRDAGHMSGVTDPIRPRHRMAWKRVEQGDRAASLRVVDERVLRIKTADGTDDDAVVVDVCGPAVFVAQDRGQ